MERMAEPCAGKRVARHPNGNPVAHRRGQLECGAVERLDRLECIDCAVGGVFAKGHLDLTDFGAPIFATRRLGSALAIGPG
jgi:hypothetical protein